MELEIIGTSAWDSITAILVVIGVGSLMVGFIGWVAGYWNHKVLLITVITGLILSIGAGTAIGKLSEHRIAQQESSFSQQLEEEYKATSSRSLKEMRKDFYKYNEAATVFTRDGEQTTVFVKKIGDDDKKLTMVFTVVDEKALYPKAK